MTEDVIGVTIELVTGNTGKRLSTPEEELKVDTIREKKSIMRKMT